MKRDLLSYFPKKAIEKTSAVSTPVRILKRKEPEHPESNAGTVPKRKPRKFKKLPRKLQNEVCPMIHGVDPSNKREVLNACSEFLDNSYCD